MLSDRVNRLDAVSGLTVTALATGRLACRCSREGSLVVEVRDNGCGIPARPAAGVGLRSMGERAVEVGGRLDLRPAPGGGTVVRADLPVIGHVIDHAG